MQTKAAVRTRSQWQRRGVQKNRRICRGQKVAWPTISCISVQSWHSAVGIVHAHMQTSTGNEGGRWHSDNSKSSTGATKWPKSSYTVGVLEYTSCASLQSSCIEEHLHIPLSVTNYFSVNAGSDTADTKEACTGRPYGKLTTATQC